MKKMIAALLLSSLVIAGCSEKETAAPVKEKKEPKVEEKQEKSEPQEVQTEFGKEINLSKRDFEGNKEELAKVIVNNFRIETVTDHSDLETDSGSNFSKMNQKSAKKDAEYFDTLFDYILLDLSVENISGSELQSSVLTERNFVFYNENGAEIDASTTLNEGTFEAANLRPNGKNQGTVWISIPEGTQVSEIILYTDPHYRDSEDWYNFKVNN
ncbi:hypothetical protein ACFSO7_02515 [Bacillus sp. CGMCC 1.16607]|uniref:hypothetical protein n=1 Tax=Bacillus sp. CGMCC 1.16607 TaxID=3351842 RepID=UPI00362F6B11